MTTTQVSPRLYPGMNCHSVEFFNSGNGVKAIMNGKVRPFNELPLPVYLSVKEEMQKHPEAVAILEEWYPGSEIKQMEKFIHCRYGGLDYTADLNETKFQEAEYWECPLRGHCKGEGKVCRMMTYNGHSISGLEIKIIQASATSQTNEVIAENLNLALGTFHDLKKKLYEKLKIQTKQEAAVIAFLLNII